MQVVIEGFKTKVGVIEEFEMGALTWKLDMIVCNEFNKYYYFCWFLS